MSDIGIGSMCTCLGAKVIGVTLPFITAASKAALQIRSAHAARPTSYRNRVTARGASGSLSLRHKSVSLYMLSYALMLLSVAAVQRLGSSAAEMLQREKHLFTYLMPYEGPPFTETDRECVQTYARER